MADDGDFDLDLDSARPASHEIIDDLVDKAIRDFEIDESLPDDAQQKQKLAIIGARGRIRGILMEWFQWHGDDPPRVDSAKEKVQDELDTLHNMLERIADEY